MDKPMTWNELRAFINMKVKDNEEIDWIDIGFPYIDLQIVRYNGNKIKIYDKSVPNWMDSPLPTTTTSKKNRKPITSLIPTTKKKKTKKITPSKTIYK